MNLNKDYYTTLVSQLILHIHVHKTTIVHKMTNNLYMNDQLQIITYTSYLKHNH